MDRTDLYRPPTSLLDLDDDDEPAPWLVERPAPGTAILDPALVNHGQLVSALDPEVKPVSSLYPGRRQSTFSEPGGDTATPCSETKGGDNDTALQLSGDNSLRPRPSLLSPEAQARLAEQAQLADHYSRIQAGQFKLDLDFVLVHANRKGFHPGKLRQGRDGKKYRSVAPSDWARFFVRIKLNGEHWKVNLAPPEIWAVQCGDPIGERRSRVAGPVTYYREIIEGYLEQADPDAPPHEDKLWLGLLWRGKPGDPDFSRGPRYTESDMTWIVIETDEDLKPISAQVGCVLPSWHDEAAGDPGASQEVDLVERQTKRQIWREKAGRTEGRDPVMKWVWFKPGYVLTDEDKAVVSPKDSDLAATDED